MSGPASDPSAAIDATAAILGLKIPAEYRRGVETYYALAAGMAALLEQLPLTPADESGSVFRPVEPAGDA